MKKLAKVLLIVAVLLAAVLAGAVAVLKKMFPPEKIKAIVAQQAEQKLHRQVRLGRVSLGIFSGISIDDFALSESPDFSRGTFIESGKFTLKFQLLPLLRKQVVIDAVELASPKIRVVRNADGTFNFSDLASASSAPQTTAAPQKPSGPAQPINLTISKAVISKGKVEFSDLSKSRIKVVVSPIDLTVSGTGLDKPMSVDLAFTLDSWMLGKGLKGTLESKSVVDLKEQRLDIESLSWKMNALTLDLKGKIRNFSRPDLDLSSTLTVLNLRALSGWIPLPPELSVSGKPTLTVDLKGGLDDLDAGLKLELSKASVDYADLFHKDDQTGMSLSFKGRVRNQESAKIDSLELKLASIEASLTGEAYRLQSPDPGLKVRLSLKPFDLKDLSSFSKVAAAYSPSGRLSLEGTVSGTLKSPKADAALRLDDIGAKYEQYALEALTGKIDATDQTLEVSQLTGRIGSKGRTPADFKIQASLRDFKQPDIALNADFSELDLGMFTSGGKSEPGRPAPKSGGGPAKPYKGPEIRAEGKITVAKFIYTTFEGQDLRASWKLSGVTPVLDKMNGTFQMETGKGKIYKTPLLSALAPVLRIDPSGLVYSRIGGHWNIARGDARTEDFRIDSPQVELFAKGSVYLPTARPDLSLIAKLPAGSVGGTIGELSSDEQGRPTFAFRLKGDWKPSLDTSQVQKRAVQKATQEIQKKGQEILQKEGQKLLQDIFK